MKLLDFLPGRRRARLDLWQSRAAVGAALAVVGAAAAFFAVRVWRKQRASSAAQSANDHIQDLIDEGSMESFPASDPPSSMSPSTVLSGEPRRP